MASATLSVIIPALNEADGLEKTLASAIVPNAGIEVIVADGGSTDATVAIARAQGVRVVVHGRAGRAQQMNAGAAVAAGEILLFLHADTCLPEDYAACVRTALVPSDAIAGAFELGIDAPGIGLRCIEWGVWQRSHWLQLPYGDQALFLRAADFRALGGFPPLPILEDLELVRQLRRQGRVAIVPQRVLTSGRRWQEFGIVRTTLLNQAILAGRALGVPPARLARWYCGIRARQLRLARDRYSST
ncbi:glycosyltransferase involved in cell wall biogenesis [Rubidibacter lacunae KORDI 51-2]|uniref:4,4'-diaponeurosporenoate glycosyltransferase n=1 Tax=Rubidibacter lacunae KORDI 51-2 TaxID=582515 RepID=U5DLX5_9CHRO|nr:TIGR04283 family arsenosugar biosynthesis glycosyltransferase [Rubidibacter lacunae]ERN40710.1 glycosyltransferase involved in cell wall biogenesis [Rubidibacter lacunae KORDI 51-2]